MPSENENPLTKKEKRRQAWKSLPDVWALMKPRRTLLIGGFALMAVNRLSGLVLPASTKFFVDNVVTKRQIHLLTPIVLAVLGATILQGITSFTLTQLLSKSAQKMITDLRRQVQAHIGRLPVSFYDANKTGVLVSRIMSDVEGVRNLVGTGLVEFVGGIMTAVFALVYLIHTSVAMTGVAFSVLLIFGFAINKAFADHPPDFSRASENYRRSYRTPYRIAGRRSGGEGLPRRGSRRRASLPTGVQRLLDNVLKTLTATSLMSLSAAGLMGIVSAFIMEFGAHKILAGTMTLGEFFAFNVFLGLLIAPVFQIVAIGTQITEAITGLERTREILNETKEDDDPRRTVKLGRINGQVLLEDVTFAYDTRKEVLHDVSFTAEPGTVTALVGPSGAGKSTIIGLLAAFYVPKSGRVLVDGIDLSTVKLESYRTQLGVVLQETFLFDGTIRENVAFARPDATEEDILAACRIARVDEFAEGFEKGYDTVVGERGVKLSGGQKQRVSIARAILADPRILILDEATSSLDSESEALDSGRLALPDARTHHVCNRPSPIDHSPRRSNFGGGRRPDHRARHARIALRARRPLLRSLYQATRRCGEPVSGPRRKQLGWRRIERHRFQRLESRKRPRRGQRYRSHRRDAPHPRPILNSHR